MKTTTITAILVVATMFAFAQPKKHYITKTRIDSVLTYEPDTIPIYFKELVFTKGILSPPYEQWVTGFVVWQTYKPAVLDTSRWQYGDGSITFNGGTVNRVQYYKDEYQPTIQLLKGKFLYLDKTEVKQPVLETLKR